MKKLTIALCAIAMGTIAAKADLLWNWWTTSNEGSPLKTDMRGCSLGIASKLGDVSGAQIDLLFHKAKNFRAGLQWAFAYSQAETLRNGVQMAYVNKAKGASLQFGLICINDEGFLPFFVFFNFSLKYFGSERHPICDVPEKNAPKATSIKKESGAVQHNINVEDKTDKNRESNFSDLPF